MQVHRYRVPSEEGQTHWRFLCSDLHLGSPNADVKRLVRDLDDARRAKARVLVNGDVFDAIARHDKRSDAATLIKPLRGSKDLLNDTVKYVAGVLGPYADAIDVIGIGNHEEAWIKWSEFDPVGALLERLNGELATQGESHRIRHGGICGWWQTTFEVTEQGVDSNARACHTLYYFHGAGGDSPVTKGTIDVNRKSVQFLYDAITFGHKHNRLFMDDVIYELTQKGYVRVRERKALQTGSYYVNYARQGQKDVLDYSYATSKAHAPKPLGGLWLGLTPRRERVDGNGSSLWRVDQTVSTGLAAVPA